MEQGRGDCGHGWRGKVAHDRWRTEREVVERLPPTLRTPSLPGRGCLHSLTLLPFQSIKAHHVKGVEVRHLRSDVEKVARAHISTFRMLLEELGLLKLKPIRVTFEDGTTEEIPGYAEYVVGGDETSKPSLLPVVLPACLRKGFPQTMARCPCHMTFIATATITLRISRPNCATPSKITSPPVSTSPLPLSFCRYGRPQLLPSAHALFLSGYLLSRWCCPSHVQYMGGKSKDPGFRPARALP